MRLPRRQAQPRERSGGGLLKYDDKRPLDGLCGANLFAGAAVFAFNGPIHDHNAADKRQRPVGTDLHAVSACGAQFLDNDGAHWIVHEFFVSHATLFNDGCLPMTFA